MTILDSRIIEIRQLEKELGLKEFKFSSKSKLKECQIIEYLKNLKQSKIDSILIRYCPVEIFKQISDILFYRKETSEVLEITEDYIKLEEEEEEKNDGGIPYTCQ